MNKFQEYVQMIEKALARESLDINPEFYEPISYILLLEGKRFRPALTLAACDLFDGKLEEALMPALGVEIFHNFSLIHDDMMDNAPLRRGKKTVHEKWNTNVAVLSGDAMLVKAYQCMIHDNCEILPKLLKKFSKTALQVCKGQHYDMSFEHKKSVTEKDYLEMVRLKTSVLIGTALEIGALIVPASSANCKALYNFGVNIGIAFQMQDDLLDSFGDSIKLGKKIGGDILNGKKTLLQIYANGAFPEALINRASPENKVKAHQKWFRETGAKKYVEEKRDQFYRKAIENLHSVTGRADIKIDLVTFAKSLVRG